MSMSLWDTERRAEKHHVFKNCRLNVVKPLPSFMSIIFILYLMCEFIPISNHIFCLSCGIVLPSPLRLREKV